jgi:hypothetical protein
MKAIPKVKSFGIGYCIRFSFEHLDRDVGNIVYGFLAFVRSTAPMRSRV